MTEWTGIVLLYVIGSVLLIVELFLPAHGLLGMVGLGVLGYGLFRTFEISQVAGLIGLIAVAITLPTGLIISVKNWHRTPIGRRISPPNPVLTEKDRLATEEFESLIGKTGRSLTVLRPVGTCVFDGQRVECTAEQGMIEADVPVLALSLKDRTISVRTVADSEGTADRTESNSGMQNA